MKNIKFFTNIMLTASTVMLAFSGLLGLLITRFCLYIIVGCLAIEIFLIKWNKFQLISFFIICISSIFTSWRYGQNVANALVFATSMILIIQGMNQEFSRQSWVYLKKCSYVVALTYIVLYIANPSWTQHGQLLFFFDNPNMTGIACCAPTIILLLISVENRGKKGNFVNWILFGFLVYFVFLSQNRSSFISIILILICTVIDRISSTKKRIKSSLLFTLMKLSPIIVMGIYVILYTYLPQDLMLFGKPFFSGRELAWKFAIQSYFANPLSHQMFEFGTLNIVLETMNRYGSIAAAAFFVLLISIKMDNIPSKSSVQYLAYISFIICLLQQCFESTLVTGSYSVYVWTYSLIGIAFMEEQPKTRIGVLE